MLWSLICLENGLQYSDERHSGYSKYYYCTAGGLHTADVSSMLLHGYLSGFLVQMFTSEHAQPPLPCFLTRILLLLDFWSWKEYSSTGEAGVFFLFFFFLKLVGAMWVCEYVPVGSAPIANDSICRYLLWAFLFSLYFLLWLLLVPTVFDSGDSASSVNTPSPSLSSCRCDDSLCTLYPDGIKNFVASWFFLSMAAATVT